MNGCCQRSDRKFDGVLLLGFVLAMVMVVMIMVMSIMAVDVPFRGWKDCEITRIFLIASLKLC
jgi:hypothetical protein